MPRPNPPDCAPSGMTNVPCPGRVAILSHVLPPAPSGQAAVLERLLQAWPHDEYRLISGAETIGDVQASSSGFLLRVHRYTRGLLRQTRFHGIVSAVDFALRLLGKAVTISRILKRETCRAIVACTGDLLDLPAACLAGWWTRVPFYIYVFDDYERQWVNPRAGGFAKRWMPRMIWRAAGVIVTNERLRDEYVRRYGIDPVIVRNPWENSPLTFADARPWPTDPNEIRIIYTGSVYGAQLQAFVDLIAALHLLPRADVRLHIYTSQTSESLVAQGISGPVAIHGHLSREEVRSVQRDADVLFLPLAFDSPYEEGLIETSAPGKMAEYLAAGRPVLVHAPEKSYVASYFRQHDCGCVVTHHDPHELASRMAELLSDEKYRLRIVRNAKKRAMTDFDLTTAQAVFRQVVCVGRHAGRCGEHRTHRSRWKGTR